jgi:hypothetical protein
MLDYNKVLEELRLRIAAYSNKKKETENEAVFFSELTQRLQAQYDDLKDKGEQGATQEDLYKALELLRGARQRRVMKMCYDNKWYIGLGIYLFGVVSANIYHKLKKE